MLQIGRNISNLNDKLETASLKQLISLIKYTPREIKELINHIEKIRNIDKDKFKEALKLLPYFTPGIYNPPYRKSENFGCIHYLLATLKPHRRIYEIITKREEITCAFRLIEDNNILIIIKLDKPVYDRVIYDSLCRKYLKNFISIHFPEMEGNYREAEPENYFHITHDKNLYVNENAESINIKALIDEKEYYVTETGKPFKQRSSSNLTDEILKIIEEKTGIKKRRLRSDRTYLGYYEKFESRIDRIKERLREFEIEHVDVKNIFRGRKIMLNSGKKGFCEINIFITENGFKIVEAIRDKMNKEVLEEAKIILRQELILKP